MPSSNGKGKGKGPRMIVVSDTAPLISLMKIGRLDLLKAMYGAVAIPPAVYFELTSNARFADEAEQVKNCAFLTVTEISDYAKVHALQSKTGLDIGESEAIVLAEDARAELLLMDEIKGRMVAKGMGLNIAGAVGVLIAAYAKNLISADEVRAAVDVLHSSGRFISEELLTKLLESL